MLKRNFPLINTALIHVGVTNPGLLKHKLAKVQERIADALERIADALQDYFPTTESRRSIPCFSIHL